MANIVRGSDVSVLKLVDADYIVIGCADNIEFEIENEIILKTDVNAGLFRKKRVRISDVRGRMSGLTTLYDTSSRISAFGLLQEAVVRTTMSLRFLYTDADGIVRMIDGDFVIQSERISSQTDNFSEFDLALEGSGGFIISELPSPEEVTGYQTYSDWWLPSNGATAVSGMGQNGGSFAGHEVLAVIREASPPLTEVSSGPNDREYTFNGTTLGFEAANPFNGSEKVFVIWQQTV